MKESELLELKQEFPQIRQEASELKGENKSILKQIKNEWGCKSIKEVKALVKKLEKENTTIERDIKEGLEELDKYFE
jgi:predicted transcriptional regulator